MAEEGGESPEVARHIELRDMIAANHLSLSKDVVGVRGLVVNLGENLDNHADDDRRTFDAQSKATEALRTTLASHIATSDAKSGGRIKVITAALVSGGAVVGGWFKWMGPSN